MSDPKRTLELHQLADETLETMRAAVRKAQEESRKAQEESRRQGVTLSYSINGVMHYELPTGEITRENPWKDAQPRATEG